jgi:hypothetical protein
MQVKACASTGYTFSESALMRDRQGLRDVSVHRARGRKHYAANAAWRSATATA